MVKPNVVGRLRGGIEIVEVLCPVCGSDRNEPVDSRVYECCRCGQRFAYDYGKEEKKK